MPFLIRGGLLGDKPGKDVDVEQLRDDANDPPQVLFQDSPG